MIARKEALTARIGIFAVGHNTYWGQFEGLNETLLGYHKKFQELLSKNSVEIIDYGMIDDGEKAARAAQKMAGDRLDLLFCNMVTYATSTTFVPIIRNVDIPIVLVGLQPRKALDYEKANTRMQLENDNICAIPEFTGVAVRMGRKVNDVILGVLEDDPDVQRQLSEWCRISHVLHGLKYARIGLMGHVMEAMYDMHTDPTNLAKTFGIHIPLIEVDDLVSCYDQVKEYEISWYMEKIKNEFNMPDPVSDPITEKLTEEDLYEAAKTAAALEYLVQEKSLTGLAYYYESQPGSLTRHVVSSLIVGNSMLIAQGFPMCGECDIKTCVAMLIMDRLEIGGSFAEFHPFDFDEGFILVGHDGPHHLQIADGKPVLRSLKKYHGKPGKGASVEFKLKEGPITIMGISQNSCGEYKFVLGEGYSEKGPIPPTGNTNTRGFFEPSAKEFIKRWVMAGPTHHYALGIGHHAETIAKIAEILGVEYEIVSRAGK